MFYRPINLQIKSYHLSELCSTKYQLLCIMFATIDNTQSGQRPSEDITAGGSGSTMPDKKIKTEPGAETSRPEATISKPPLDTSLKQEKHRYTISYLTVFYSVYICGFNLC
jgi:hypothetical protein